MAKKLGAANNIRDLKTVKLEVADGSKNEILLVVTFDVSIDKKLLAKVIKKPLVAGVKDAEVISLGGQVHFHSQVTAKILEHNQINGIEINHQDK